MKCFLITALAVGIFFTTGGAEPKRPGIGDEVVIPAHPSCVLKVIRVSAPIDSGTLFYRQVVLELKNDSDQLIELSGYGAGENPMILHEFQEWNEKEKRWPSLTVRGVCGTGLRSFGVPPKGKLKFMVSIPATVESAGFRFGVVVRDADRPDGAITFTKAATLPKAEQ